MGNRTSMSRRLVALVMAFTLAAQAIGLLELELQRINVSAALSVMTVVENLAATVRLF